MYQQIERMYKNKLDGKKYNNAGVTADLDPPRSKSVSGYEPLFADLGPPTKLSY